MNHRRKELIRTLSSLAVIVILLAAGSIFFYRFDVTSDKRYSITSITRNLYKELPQPVKITYYKTEGIEKVVPALEDVLDILGEIAVSSRGKIKLETADPAGKGYEKELDSMGIKPFELNVVKGNKKTAVKVYSAVKIQFLNRYKVIPAVYDTTDLEYQVVSKIRELVQNRRRVAGIMIGDRSKTLAGNYTLLVNTLSSDFDLVNISPGTSIEAGLNVLIVIGNNDLGPEDKIRISDFIDRGGNVLFAVDGVYVDLGHNLKASALSGNDILGLLKLYGVSVGNTLILDPFSKEFRTPKTFYGNVAWQTIGPYPEWVSIRTPAGSGNPVTAHFTGLDLLWASPLRIRSVPGVDTEVLLTSSTLAWEMKPPFKTSPFTVREYGSGRNAEKKRFNLAAAVSKGRSRMIIIGDSDFVSDLVQYSDSYYNMRFILNSVDWLSQNDDFMTIRTRHDVNTALDRYIPAKRNAVYLLSQILNIILIPLLVLVIGLSSLRRRLKKR